MTRHWAKEIADKYILPDGSDPRTDRPTFSDKPESIATLASFIGWHEDHELWGGRTAAEAMTALGKLTNLQPEFLRRVARGK